MRSNLPNWPVSDTLLAATKELLDLGEGALNPRSGIPDSVKDRLARYLEYAGTFVWTSADRVAAAAMMSSGRPKGLEAELNKIQRLLQAVREAGNALADLTLSGGGTELQSVEQDFRKLSDVAESLAADDVKADCEA